MSGVDILRSILLIGNAALAAWSVFATLSILGLLMLGRAAREGFEGQSVPLNAEWAPLTVATGLSLVFLVAAAGLLMGRHWGPWLGGICVAALVLWRFVGWPVSFPLDVFPTLSIWLGAATTLAIIWRLAET